MYRYFSRKCTWILPRHTVRRQRKDRFCFCLQCGAIVGLGLVLFTLLVVPKRSISRPPVTRQWVYSDDTKLSLPLQVVDKLVNATHINGFPKITHHIFEKLDNVPPKPEWVKAHQSCISQSQGFTHMMWNTSSIRSFLVKNYGWFVKTFDSYKYPVQKFDVARYFLLYHYGGVYIDMDIYCKEQLAAVITSFPKNSRVVLRATHPTDDVATSLLFGHAKTSFFYFVTQHLQGAKHDSIFPYISIMFSTGPRYLSNSYYAFENYSQMKSGIQRTGLDSSGIFILKQRFYKILFKDIGSGSWHEWDAKFILFIYQHLPSFVTGLFI